jgi:4'-phosphopantetheinyl transferase EntD
VKVPSDGFATPLPGSAVGVTATATMWDTPVLPEEERLVGRAGGTRVREFRAGRHCAHAALDRLGFPPVAILRRPGGDPCWPSGVVGSITHASGHAAAAVATAADLAGLGIDAEPHSALEPAVAALVCTSPELSWCRGRDDGVYWETVMFSAKEAVYKAWYPLAATFLEFDEIEVRLDPAAGSFRVRPASPRAAGADGVHGRFRVAAGLVHTVAWLAAGDLIEGMGRR